MSSPAGEAKALGPAPAKPLAGPRARDLADQAYAGVLCVASGVQDVDLLPPGFPLCRVIIALVQEALRSPARS